MTQKCTRDKIRQKVKQRLTEERGLERLPYKYNKLRGRIVEKYGTQDEFARTIGISRNSLSLKMTGKTGISQTDIIKWCQLLDIKADEIGQYFFA